MRPEPSCDSPADERPGFSPASRPDENLREQLSRLVPKLPGDGSLPPQITHVHRIPAREGQYSPWPHWLHPRVIEAFESLGVHEPYTHQVQAAQAAHCAFDAALAEDAHRLSFGRASGQGRDESGTTARHVIVATGTASGKSLSYLMPAFDALYRGARREPLSATATNAGSTGFHQRANVLYISPARALSADQLNAITAYHLPGLNAATYDGDTPAQERRWVREHANFVLTTPDMLNYGVLGNHRQWANFLRGLRYVVLDEVHSYRGVFGAHIANLLRRLRRVCALYRVNPVFYGASATSANPAKSFAKLIGVPEGNVDAITTSTAPRGESTVILWEPEFLPDTQVRDKLAAGASAFDTRSEAEKQAPQRISAIEQGAQMLTDLILSRTRTLAFTRSRRGAELISQRAQRYLDETEAGLAHRVAAYRSGYMPEERRELEHRLRTGELLGLASTSALELGIDISGLDAVLVAGWPGTRASFIQRIGRAGRGGQDALAVLIAGDDPLDTYLVHHPQAIFGQSVEATVFDPTNPYVLSPHLCAAAAESPLRAEELSLFGEHTEALLNRLVQQNYLRRRADGWYWTHAESATNLVDLRATGGCPYQLIDAEDGSLIGTMDSAQAMTQGELRPVRGARDPHGLPRLRPDHEGDRRLYAHDHRRHHDPHHLLAGDASPQRRRAQHRRHPGHPGAAQPVALHDQLLRAVRRQRHRDGLCARRLGAAHRRGPPRRAHRRHHHRPRHRRGRPVPVPERGSRLGRERSRPRDRAFDPPGLRLRLYAHHFRAHLQHGLFAVLLDGAPLLGRADHPHAHRPRRRGRGGLRGLPHGLQEADRRHVSDHRVAGRRPPRRPRGRLAARALRRPARGEPASQAHSRPRAQAARLSRPLPPRSRPGRPPPQHGGRDG